MNNDITLFLIEDQLLDREAIKCVLQPVKTIKIIGEAASGQEALRQLEKLQPDVILLDLNLPDMNGLILTKKLHQHDPTTRILILTAQISVDLPHRLVKAGAVGYLTKNQPANEIIDAIQSATTQQPLCASSLLTEVAMQSINASDWQKKLAKLSDIELRIMCNIASGSSTQEIADRLHLTVQTINVYRGKILKKLELPNEVVLTHEAVKHGLIDVYSSTYQAAKLPNKKIKESVR